MSSKYHIKIKVQKKEAKSITQSQPLITPETPATTAHHQIIFHFANYFQDYNKSLKMIKC